MSASLIDFLEIEHKFIVDASFELKEFAATVMALGPIKEKSLQVLDTYYLPHSNPDFIYRHRIDEEIQQLTIKSRGKENEVRTEINLELGANPSQESAIIAWMKLVGTSEGYPIEKAIWVFEFQDCEIVHYEARQGDKSVACVEFEAIGASSEEEAIATLNRYENQLGFDPNTRTRINLFDLLVPQTL